MKCGGCGNEEATHVRIRYTDNRERIEVCDRCGNLAGYALPDASCPNGGYFDENLADTDHRKGQWVRSKEHKAALLKQLGLEEAGSTRNPQTGKVMPYIKDPVKRRKYFIDNFGG